MKNFTRICSALLIGSMSFALSASAQNSAEKTKATKKSTCTFFSTVVPGTQQNEKCYGQSNGGAAIAPLFGGTAPYTYAWSPSISSTISLDTLDIVAGLAAGSYTCTVTDNNGCTSSVVLTITQPTKLGAKVTSVTEDKCFGSNNGSVTVIGTGGTTPYTSYKWTPAVSTTATASNLAAGNYIVTVTDTNKCTGSDTVTITQPVAITTYTAVVPSSCKSADGGAGVTAYSGVAPYTYSWAPGGNTTDTITGVGAGSYTCTVTDANGCAVSPKLIVTDSTTLAISLVNQANEKCFGNSIGLAALSVTGGTGLTDTYMWTPSGGTGTTASGLSAGTYTFTATDSIGCQAIKTLTITQPKMLRDSMTKITNVLCFGASTGRVTDAISGGTGPFTYSWSTGATSSNLNNVAAGSYSVTVTDANGCVDSAKVTLTQPATAVGDNNTVTPIACYEGTGGITVTPSGGVSPYTYTWSGGSSNTTNTATGLVAGTYVISIRDSNKCRLRDTVILTQPPSFITSTDTSMAFPCSSKASVQVTGLASGYTFSWSNSQTTDTATGLCAGGMYVVTITNSTSGCVEKDTIVIEGEVGIQQLSNQQSIKVYPVPATNQINISITGGSFSPDYIAIYDITGRQLSNEKVNGSSSLYTLDVSKLSEGTYFIKLIGNGEKVVKFTVAGR